MSDLIDFLNNRNPIVCIKHILDCLKKSENIKETRIESIETQVKCLEKLSQLSSLDAPDIQSLGYLSNMILKKLNIIAACMFKQDVNFPDTQKEIIQRCYVGTINTLNVVFKSNCLENFEMHLNTLQHIGSFRINLRRYFPLEAQSIQALSETLIKFVALDAEQILLSHENDQSLTEESVIQYENIIINSHCPNTVNVEMLDKILMFCIQHQEYSPQNIINVFCIILLNEDVLKRLLNEYDFLKKMIHIFNNIRIPEEIKKQSEFLEFFVIVRDFLDNDSECLNVLLRRCLRELKLDLLTTGHKDIDEWYLIQKKADESIQAEKERFLKETKIQSIQALVGAYFKQLDAYTKIFPQEQLVWVNSFFEKLRLIEQTIIRPQCADELISIRMQAFLSSNSNKLSEWTKQLDQILEDIKTENHKILRITQLTTEYNNLRLKKILTEAEFEARLSFFQTLINVFDQEHFGRFSNLKEHILVLIKWASALNINNVELLKKPIICLKLLTQVTPNLGAADLKTLHVFIDMLLKKLDVNLEVFKSIQKIKQKKIIKQYYWDIIACLNSSCLKSVNQNELPIHKVVSNIVEALIEKCGINSSKEAVDLLELFKIKPMPKIKPHHAVLLLRIAGEEHYTISNLCDLIRSYDSLDISHHTFVHQMMLNQVKSAGTTKQHLLQYARFVAKYQQKTTVFDEFLNHYPWVKQDEYSSFREMDSEDVSVVLELFSYSKKERSLDGLYEFCQHIQPQVIDKKIVHKIMTYCLNHPSLSIDVMVKFTEFLFTKAMINLNSPDFRKSVIQIYQTIPLKSKNTIDQVSLLFKITFNYFSEDVELLNIVLMRCFKEKVSNKQIQGEHYQWYLQQKEAYEHIQSKKILILQEIDSASLQKLVVDFFQQLETLKIKLLPLQELRLIESIFEKICFQKQMVEKLEWSENLIEDSFRELLNYTLNNLLTCETKFDDDNLQQSQQNSREMMVAALVKPENAYPGENSPVLSQSVENPDSSYNTQDADSSAQIEPTALSEKLRRIDINSLFNRTTVDTFNINIEGYELAGNEPPTGLASTDSGNIQVLYADYQTPSQSVENPDSSYDTQDADSSAQIEPTALSEKLRRIDINSLFNRTAVDTFDINIEGYELADNEPPTGLASTDSGNDYEITQVLYPESYQHDHSADFQDPYSAPQFVFLAPSQVSPLSIHQVPYLAANQVRFVAPHHVPFLVPQQIPFLASYQIPYLQPHQIPYLQSYQIPYLQPHQIPYLQSYQIPYLQSYQIPYLQPHQIFYLLYCEPTYFPEINDNQHYLNSEIQIDYPSYSQESFIAPSQLLHHIAPHDSVSNQSVQTTPSILAQTSLHSDGVQMGLTTSEVQGEEAAHTGRVSNLSVNEELSSESATQFTSVVELPKLIGIKEEIPSDWHLVIERMRNWQSTNDVDLRTYKNFSFDLKRLKTNQEILNFLTEMLDKNIYPNVFLINQIMNKLKNIVDVIIALRSVLVSRNMDDAWTHSATLSAMRKSAKYGFKEASELFEEAKRRSLVNGHSYSIMISMIANSSSPDVGKAFELFEEAKNQRPSLANTIIYHSMLDVIANSSEPDICKGLDLFREAIERGLADGVIYNSMLAVIAKICDINSVNENLYVLANSILQQKQKNFNCPDLRDGDVLDLHEMSYGEVYFGLKNRLENELQNKSQTSGELLIIYGKGIHSRNKYKLTDHPLKKAVKRVISELANPTIFIKENARNLGQIVLVISPKISLTTHSVFKPKILFSNSGANADETQSPGKNSML